MNGVFYARHSYSVENNYCLSGCMHSIFGKRQEKWELEWSRVSVGIGWYWFLAQILKQLVSLSMNIKRGCSKTIIGKVATVTLENSLSQIVSGAEALL